MAELSKDSKILITGAGGFLGAHLTRRLHGLGYKLRTIGRSNIKPHILDDLDVEHFGCDITNPEQVASTLKGVDVVYHLAGLVSYRKQDQQRQFGVNVLGTRNIMDASLKHGVQRIIHTGSIAGMGLPSPGKIADESIEYNLAGKGLNYCDSKYEAELQAKHFFSMNAPVIMLNPGIVFGEGDTHPHHHAIFHSMAKGGMFGVPPGGIPFADIQDIVEAHVNALTMGRLGERYALVSANHTFKEAAEIFAKVFGGKPPVVEIPGPLLVGVGALVENISPKMGISSPPVTRQSAWLSQHKIFFSSQKAVDELKFPQTPFIETVKRTAPYYQEYHKKVVESGSRNGDGKRSDKGAFWEWLQQYWA